MQRLCNVRGLCLMQRTSISVYGGCTLCRETKRDQYLILCNSDVCEVWRLDTEVCHINGAGCRSSYSVPDYLPLHVKYLFVGFVMHRQVADELKMNGLPITIARG